MRSPRYVSKLARDLRKRPTLAEEVLWKVLCGKQMDGVKFHRQRPLGRYILEFYAPSVGLVIEADGEIHQQPAQKEYDRECDLFLNSRGLRVIRFTNRQILNDIDYCRAEIHAAIIESIMKARRKSPS